MKSENVIYSHVSSIDNVKKEDINEENVLIIRDGDTAFDSERL